MRRAFDCAAVCPYDKQWEAEDLAHEREALSRVGNLIRYSIVSVKRLFHMLVGLAFMLLTLAGASLTFAEWEGYRKSPEEGLIHFTMFGGFTVFLAILCLYSFVKARNVH